MQTKTIYELKLHKTITIEEKIGEIELSGNRKEDVIKKYEVTRVPGGWCYSFDFPNFRQSPVVFVPFNNEFQK